jgi:iron complex outermembrane receptor protein
MQRHQLHAAVRAVTPASQSLHTSPAPHRWREQRLRLNPVAAVCASLLGAPLLAFAQAAPAPGAAASAPQSLETVVVTGLRRSIESSINLKKNSDSVVEAISAEDVGKLPDASIAEALARVPGLAAQRVDGRAQVIAIRGMSPDFAGTLLNGREQTSTGTNRGVEFDQYPAELLSNVLIYKTPDAQLLGQGLSGTIDLQTVRPLAVGQRRVVVNLRGEKNSLGDLNHGYGGTKDTGQRFSASYIDQNDDKTLGVAVGFAHLDAPGQELHYKAWGFQTDDNCIAHQNDWGCHPITGQTPGAATYMTGFEATAVSRREKRDGLMGVVEFKPNADLHSLVDLYYSKFKQAEVMRGLMGSIGDGWGVPGSVFSNVTTTPVGGQTLVTGATTTMVPNAVLRNDANHRNDTLKSVGWNAELKTGDWVSVADLSYSNAKREEQLFETYAGTASTPTITFNLPTTPGYPSITTPTNFNDIGGVQLSDPAGWGHAGRLQKNTQDDTIKALRLQTKRALDWGMFNEVTVGLNETRREKTRNFDVYFATLKAGATHTPLTAADQLSPTSLGFVGLGNVLSYDVDSVASKYYTMTQSLSGGAGGDLGKNFTVHERVTTAFGKLDIDTHVAGLPIHGNLGLQAARTNQGSTANAFDSSGKVIGTIDPGTTYTDVLPSLNLVGDLEGDRKVRFGLAKTMARPRIDDMNAASSAGVDTNTKLWGGSGGNPKLKPWRAVSVDLSLEQYIGRRSYVALAGFYKKLNSYIYSQSIPYDFTGFINATPAVVPINSLGTYTTQANGQGGNMRGLELSTALDGALLSKSLEGFGALATVSVTNSSIKVSGPTNTELWATLPGLSKTVAGLTLYYESNGYSFRINDRYRSKFRGEYASLFGATSVQRTLSQNQVDLQASYEFQGGAMKGLQLLLQMVNLTNAADRTVQDGAGFGGVTAPLGYSTYGRQLLLGVNYKFN